MKLADFMSDWTGSGFSDIPNDEAFFEDVPACDFDDDVAEAAIHAIVVTSAMFRGLDLPEERECLACGGPMPPEADSRSTCSHSCAVALGHRTEEVTAGARFGFLVAVAIVRVDQHGAVWRFACDCGGAATRGVAVVRHRARLGLRVCCNDCGKRSKWSTNLSPAELRAASARNVRAWRKTYRKAA